MNSQDRARYDEVLSSWLMRWNHGFARRARPAPSQYPFTTSSFSTLTTCTICLTPSPSAISTLPLPLPTSLFNPPHPLHSPCTRRRPIMRLILVQPISCHDIRIILKIRLSHSPASASTSNRSTQRSWPALQSPRLRREFKRRVIPLVRFLKSAALSSLFATVS